ncbi:ABC transporter ATP-binding protein [Candidatus Bathyarchaeota archaeon]|nr:ABC transporter ATP-binding protein [Candidatus Bathyarchaeota archaeon]MBS7627461.1 ABC transporter ATP-binding protein [Candidatus Bathyarchaeota archaeon]
METPVIEVRDLVAGYGKLQVLQGISISLSDGEIVSLIGPNGSGKSTLIKSIVGLAKVFSGHILYKGVDILGFRTDRLARLGIGYVPQLSNIFLSLSVEENLEMGAYARSDGRSLRNDMEAIYSLFPELKGRRKERAENLSGGERQMLALARALMGRPKVLLLDEPTASLSPKATASIFQCLKRIRDSGTPILLAEQNALKALESSDRCYLLVAGKCIAEGPSEDILGNKDIGRLYLGLRVGA